MSPIVSLAVATIVNTITMTLVMCINDIMLVGPGLLKSTLRKLHRILLHIHIVLSSRVRHQFLNCSVQIAIVPNKTLHE